MNEINKGSLLQMQFNGKLYFILNNYTIPIFFNVIFGSVGLKIYFIMVWRIDAKILDSKLNTIQKLRTATTG